jgi:phage terminase large subunit-like protein
LLRGAELQALVALREQLVGLPREDALEALRMVPAADAEALMACWPVWARPEQLPPEGDWDDWLVLAGRGFGKTRTGAELVVDWAREDPRARNALVGRIPKDLRQVMIEGESGIWNVVPRDWRPVYNSSLATLVFPNGAQAFGFSGEVPDDLRGPQFTKAWVDEWCKMRFAKEVMEQLDFSVRLGRNTQRLWTTTPRPIPELKDLMAQPGTRVTRGSTSANRANLEKKFFARLMRKYSGTKLGQQELEAVILEEAKGALWSRDLIARSMVRTAPECVRVVISIDPSVTSSEDSDETGILVVGLFERHAYVLADLSQECGLKDAAPVALQAWRTFDADAIVGEVNNGGDLIGHTLRMAMDPETGKPAGARLPYKAIRASKGKRQRAEPVSMLYEQNLVHHVGTFPELEDEMCTWVPDQGMASPDRMDALVWALTELLVQPAPEVRVRRL